MSKAIAYLREAPQRAMAIRPRAGGRSVTCFGCNGDAYTEHYPAVDIP